MHGELRFGNGAYVRGTDGVWRYVDGGQVPGATDLTLADLLPLTGTADDRPHRRLVTREDLARLRELGAGIEALLVRRTDPEELRCGDVVVGMSAPELHPMAMLTVRDIAELAGISKATVDSYRYRGSLPEPQVVRGRTPLWSRPVVQRWLDARVGGTFNGSRSAGTVAEGADRGSHPAPWDEPERPLEDEPAS